ncbi:MAG: MFS transporter [Bacteroidota bacterium]
MKLLTGSPGLQPLQHTEFRYFIVSRFFLIMALRMLGTVAAYQLFQITRDSFSIGMAGLAEFIPVFCLALYAGHVIDRSDKRTLLLRSIWIYGLCTLAMIILTWPSVPGHFSTQTLPWLFYAIIFCTGVIRAFAGPTTHALISQLVPREILHLAANISSSTWLIASILGHASSGLLIAWFGVNHTYWIILLYVLIAAFSLLRVGKKPILAKSMDVSAWQSVKEGLRFVQQNKIMLGALSLDLFAVLFGGVVALVPEFADRILKVGPIGFGWLNAAIDIGSIITIVLMTLRPMKKKQGKQLFFAVGGFGLCIILFGLSDIYWISFLALLLAGMFDGVSVVIRGTIFQLTTPDHMRGRVSSVNSLFINSSNELGQFESGFAAKALGTVPSVLFGGCVTLIVVVITWLRAPSLRKFEY